MLRLNPSTVSRQLAILKAAGVVRDRRDGTWIHYSIADSAPPLQQAIIDCLKAGNSDVALQQDVSVIANLKKNLIEKRDLPNGYAFAFPGNNAMIDELNEFIKTERQCCDFFTFNLRVEAAGKPVWLELTGPGTVKQFITAELGM